VIAETALSTLSIMAYSRSDALWPRTISIAMPARSAEDDARLTTLELVTAFCTVTFVAVLPVIPAITAARPSDWLP
jgi:hypothetical protein